MKRSGEPRIDSQTPKREIKTELGVEPEPAKPSDLDKEEEAEWAYDIYMGIIKVSFRDIAKIMPKEDLRNLPIGINFNFFFKHPFMTHCTIQRLPLKNCSELNQYLVEVHFRGPGGPDTITKAICPENLLDESCMDQPTALATEGATAFPE